MVKELKQAIGIDLGGSKIDIALINASGTVHQQRRLETDIKGGPAAVEKQVIEVIKEMADSTHGTIQGVGVGVAGQIEEKTGSVIFAPNLNWHDHPLQKNLQKETNLPIKVINDLRAITWGEWLYGAGFGCDDLICVYVGTGVGGGSCQQW